MQSLFTKSGAVTLTHSQSDWGGVTKVLSHSRSHADMLKKAVGYSQKPREWLTTSGPCVKNIYHKSVSPKSRVNLCAHFTEIS